MGEQGKRQKIAIYYDGLCNLCAGLADKVDASQKESTFELKDIHKAGTLGDMAMDEAMHDVHVVDETGKMYKGADAILRIFAEYPHLKWLAKIGSLPGFRQLAMLIYRLVEKTRYWIFGRKTV